MCKIGWMLTKRKSTHEERVKAFKTNLLSVLNKDESKMGLREYDAVLFPIFEKNHFYVIAFDMRETGVYVFDNMVKTVYGVRTSKNYANKSTPYKVIDIFGRYLTLVGHPKVKEIMRTWSPTRVELPWKTSSNVTDCAVFAMRHMECYRGGDHVECDFSMEEDRKVEQINILRMKYIDRMLLSEVNNVRDGLLADAREWESKKPKQVMVKKVRFKEG
ncbi:uncharacterized protein LOC143636820 [Bidens hawaiensis]|uniref:uncharacterized protein LOC143636820 n=1 Tax=Bidens hawaiensis TaxID=980011 RepID=UPI00404B4A61